MNVNGHDHFGINERMARFDQLNARVGARGHIDDFGLDGTKLPAEFGLRKGKIEISKRANPRTDLGRFMPHVPGEFGQNPRNFVGFVELELTEVVVELHHHHRLNVQGNPTPRLIVYEPFDFAFVAGLDGDHIAPIAYRDNRFLERVAVLPR